MREKTRSGFESALPPRDLLRKSELFLALYQVFHASANICTDAVERRDEKQRYEESEEHAEGKADADWN